MPVTKAVVLAAGRGMRMRQADAATGLDEDQSRAADSGLKAMMPVGRPFLDYTLSALADAGVRDVCVVLAPHHDVVREHYDRRVAPTRLRIDFAVQPEPRGTADALLAARAFAGGDDFLVLNADNYYPAAVVAALTALIEQGLPGFQRDALVRRGNIGAGRIRQYAMLQVDRDGYLVDIVEKPDETTFMSFGGAALVSMNLWRFSGVMFEACERVPLSGRGEKELPGAVRFAMREMGARFRVIESSEGVLDLSTRADVARVTERLHGVQVRL
jgi:glucose-1-phosphate thymidylyltransferase